MNGVVCMRIGGVSGYNGGVSSLQGGMGTNRIATEESGGGDEG